MARQTRKAKRAISEAQRAAKLAREAKMRQIQTAAGYIVVGITVIAAIVMSLMRQLPVAVAVGLILLALFRLYALRRELSRQHAEDAQDKPAPKPKGRLGFAERQA